MKNEVLFNHYNKLLTVIIIIIVIIMICLVINNTVATLKTENYQIDYDWYKNVKTGDIVLNHFTPSTLGKKLECFTRQFLMGSEWSHVSLVVVLGGVPHLLTARPAHCSFNRFKNLLSDKHIDGLRLVNMEDEIKRYNDFDGWSCYRPINQSISIEQIINYIGNSIPHYESIDAIKKYKFYEMFFNKKIASNVYYNLSNGGITCTYYLYELLKSFNLMFFPSHPCFIEPKHFSSHYNFMPNHGREIEIKI